MKDIKDTILVLDDEPFFLDWLEDFLTAIGYKTKFVTNIENAVAQIREFRYRAFIVDLNVPANGALAEAIQKKGDVYSHYRGLYAAEVARNCGYRDRQVIVYSVHSVPAVKEITDRLLISYITKGRPHIFKDEIENVLSYDPSEENHSH